MCTILIARHVHPRFPLVIAANRDEIRARPSAPPRLLDVEHDVRGGQDLVAGGTWLGVAKLRFLTAVTNQRTHRPPDPSRASRGALVMDLLRDPSTERSRARLAAIAPNHYNGANVLVGDVQSLHVAYLRDDEATRVVAVPEGVSVLTNGELDERDAFPKIDRLIALTSPLLDDEEGLVVQLHAALGDHARPPIERIPSPPEGSMFTGDQLADLHAICVHATFGAAAYGTVSSSILLFGDDGTVARWEHVEGSPCTHPRARIL
ncbi:MAG: NRDE family protein [Deltaproteobacteria bacterium]|nr:NRDE family protein [Deltaproteobacteria bacterium]